MTRKYIGYNDDNIFDVSYMQFFSGLDYTNFIAKFKFSSKDASILKLDFGKLEKPIKILSIKVPIDYYVILYRGKLNDEHSGKYITFKSSVSDISNYTDYTLFTGAKAIKINLENPTSWAYYDNFNEDVPSPIYATEDEKNIRKDLAKNQTLKDNLIENTQDEDKASKDYKQKYEEYVKNIDDLHKTLNELLKKNTII